MKSKRKKIFLIIAASVMVLIIVAAALFYFLFFKKLEGTRVEFRYEDYVFVCPDFKSGTVVPGQNSKDVFNALIGKIEKETENWCYIGTLSGYGAFSENAVINNTGLEIVKKQGENYYQLVRTHSNGKIVAPISINSAQRSYISGDILTAATISEESRFSENGEINWSGVAFVPVAGDTDVKISSIINSVRFIAEEGIIAEESDSKVYSFGGKNYLELTLDLSAMKMPEVLNILTGKISNKAMDLGLELFSPEKMTVDMSKIACKYILEFEGEGDGAHITGRSFTMKGGANLKGLLSYNMKIDIAMNAVVLYGAEAYAITDSDLLKSNSK